MNAWPTLRVRMESADELLAVALALEQEAAARYRELSSRMATRGESVISDQFGKLAAMKNRHASDILERGERTLGHSLKPLGKGWDFSAAHDEEDARDGALSVYQALAFAVRNQERAFAYFTYVAADTDDPQIRVLAEDLARDELSHLSVLRGHRRRAFHADRPAVFTLPMNVVELRVWATAWDAEAAMSHDALAKTLDQAGDAEGAAVFRQLAGRERPAASSTAVVTTALRTPAEGLRLLEDRFERYARIGERSDDEEVVREAQRLAAEMIERLALVGWVLNDELLRPASL